MGGAGHGSGNSCALSGDGTAGNAIGGSAWSCGPSPRPASGGGVSVSNHPRW